MSAELPPKLREKAANQAGIVTRKQSIGAGMSPRAIEWKVKAGRWQQVYRGVYVAFTGEPSRRAQLWAAVLYAGTGALLSHDSAGEVQGLVDHPAAVMHVTVPAGRRVRPVPGLVIHVSDQPARLAGYPPGEIPATLIEDTIIDLAESCQNVDDVYAWVTRAFGRKDVRVNPVMLLLAVRLRKKLRWRTELNEATVAAAGGAHSALELLWDRNVEQAHGLPISSKQVPFKKRDGTTGYRDREYSPWGVIIELDGRQSHAGEQWGKDRARDRQAAVAGGSTLRYGWKETRYEACHAAVEVTWVLWRRGWRERPKPCSPDCPVAKLLDWLDNWLAAGPARAARWEQQREEQEEQAAEQRMAAQRQAAEREAMYRTVEHAARARGTARVGRRSRPEQSNDDQQPAVDHSRTQSA
jgi:hypothetical protein